MRCVGIYVFFFFKQKTAYEMRISDWSSDVCSSDLGLEVQLVIAGCVRGLRQTRKILADPRPVAVGRDQPGEPFGHSQDVERAGEDRQADGGIASLETLARLHLHEHALGQQALGELTATTPNRDGLAPSPKRQTGR